MEELAEKRKKSGRQREPAVRKKRKTRKTGVTVVKGKRNLRVN